LEGIRDGQQYLLECERFAKDSEKNYSVVLERGEWRISIQTFVL
jgi:hypothetical protein